MKAGLNSGGIVKILQSPCELAIGEDSLSTCTAAWFVYPFSAAEANLPVINKSVPPCMAGVKTYLIPAHAAMISYISKGIPNL